MAAASARGRGGGGGRSTGWYASASGAVAATVAAAARRAGGDDDEDEDEDGYDDEDEDEDDEYDDDEYDELDAAQREARNTPLPGVLLEAQDQLYALYGNEGVTEQVEAVLLAGSHPHFAGTILTVIAFLKAHFKVVNDVSLIFPELDLEFRQDSVHTRVRSVAADAAPPPARRAAALTFCSARERDLDPIRPNVGQHDGAAAGAARGASEEQGRRRRQGRAAARALCGLPDQLLRPLEPPRVVAAQRCGPLEAGPACSRARSG